jgi:hypothetical protein
VSLYLDSPGKWKRLVDYIYGDSNPIGLDSEFVGVDFDAGDNCVGRAKLDVYSIAVFTGELHPRGYERATGYVLPRESLECFKELLEDESIKKAAHNSTVDVHTFYNDGVDVRGVIDTLHLCRFAFPGRFKYGLDILSREFLDESKFMSFHELTAVPAFVTKQIKIKKCECGEDGCRKRKGHPKYTVIEDVDVERGTSNIPLTDIRPGHSKWSSYVEYAGQDAVLALELLDYTSRKLKKLNYDNPFI